MVAASRTSRRAPAAPVRARPARRSSPAVASCTARTPRDYAQRTPKKMKAAALRGALSDRARDGRVHVVTGSSTGDTPSTKAAIAGARGARHRAATCSSSLDRDDDVAWLSPAQRRPSVHLLVVDQLNTYDVLVSDDVRLHPGRARRRSSPVPRPGKSVRRPCDRAEAESRGGRAVRIADPRDILLAPVDLREELRRSSTRTSTRSSCRPDANKTQIKIAVEQVFGVKVTRVNTLNRQGKRMRTRIGLRQARRHQARHRQPRRRRPHRHLRRSGLLTGHPTTDEDRETAMGIRKYKPTTPGRRGSSVADFVEITRSEPEKSLVRPLPKKGGRNNHGRITTRHQGGGHKRAYRVIDFRRADKDGVPAKVAHIEYDPNRTARIALLHYADGEKRYIIAPNKLQQGDRVETGPGADIKPGNNLPLRNIPVGTVDPRRRAAARRRREDRPLGRCERPARRQGRPATPSCACPPARSATSTCAAAPRSARWATPSSRNINWGKAGRMRWKGKRPTVRGVAMNPVDHPHGGGEGKTSGGRHPVNPRGKPEGRTRKANKASDKFIVRRRKSGKKR